MGLVQALLHSLPENPAVRANGRKQHFHITEYCPQILNLSPPLLACGTAAVLSLGSSIPSKAAVMAHFFSPLFNSKSCLQVEPGSAVSLLLLRAMRYTWGALVFGQVDSSVGFVSAAQHPKAAVDFPHLCCAGSFQTYLGSSVPRASLEALCPVHSWRSTLTLLHRGENTVIKVCLCMRIFIYCTYWQAREIEVLCPKLQRIKF